MLAQRRIAQPTDGDLLMGVPAIADAFRLSVRQTYYLKEKHGLPTFKIGRIVCAQRGAVKAWIEGIAETAAAAAREARGRG